jgi:hypothetical protein
MVANDGTGATAGIWRSTTSSFADSTVVFSGAGVGTANSNSPYATLDFGSSLQFRCVAAGLRLSYNGTELDRGGLIVGLREPDNLSTQGFDEGDMLQYTSVRAERVPDGRWYEVTFAPSDSRAADYTDTPSSHLYEPHCMAIMVNGTNGSQPFHFEGWVHYEIVGSAARGKTKSHVDPVGASIVSSAVNNEYGGTTASLYNRVMNAVKSTATDFTTAAVAGVAQSILPSAARRIEL